jgi:hypothetical protein
MAIEPNIVFAFLDTQKRCVDCDFGKDLDVLLFLMSIGFVFNPWLGHAALLKLLGRVCHPFESHKA